MRNQPQPTPILSDTELLDYAHGRLSPLQAMRVQGILLIRPTDRRRLRTLQAATQAFASVMGGARKPVSPLLPRLAGLLGGLMVVAVGVLLWIAASNTPASEPPPIDKHALSKGPGCASCHSERVPDSLKISPLKSILSSQKGSKP